MRKIILFTIIFFVLPATQAAEYYFCDQSNSYVHLGDTLSHVQQICGQPKSVDRQKPQTTKTLPITRWIYYHIPRNPYTNYEIHRQKGVLIFDFDQEGKIVQIKVKGNPVNQTMACLTNQPLKIGDPAILVAQACWSPNDIKHLTTQIPTKHATIQTTLTYQQTSYMPATKLIFQNNKLVEIKE